MTKERTKIDNLIEPAVKKVAERNANSYFHKSSVANEVMKNRHLGGVLAELRTRYGEWKIDQLILRYIDSRVSQVLGQRDANGIRIYECYATHGLATDGRERRWSLLRAMNAASLRMVMMQTRVQARALELKGEGYEFFMEELEKLPATATIDEVYEKAIPKIRALRERG